MNECATGTAPFLIQAQTKGLFKSELNQPQMNYRFASRTGRLQIEKVLQLNMKEVITNNNLTPLERLSSNMIYCDVDEDNDFNPATSKLLKAFQYSLEYLYNRQLDLEGLNKGLEQDYSQLINDSFAIEERLKVNKLLLAKQSKEKKEREMLMTSYKAIIDYNTHGGDESNPELKELMRNPNEKYYCHLCSGKPFSTGSKLESHMKRRHINLYNRPAQMDESFENYGSKIEEMRKYFEAMLKEKEEEQMKLKYLSNLDKMRNENEKKVKEMEARLKDTLFEFKEFLLKSMKNQPQLPIILEQPKASKDNQELIKMAQSLNEINALLRAQYDKKMEDMLKEINELKNRSLPKLQEIQVIKEVKPQPKPQPSLSPQKEQRIEIKQSYQKPPEAKPEPMKKEEPVIIPEPSPHSSHKSNQEEDQKLKSSFQPLQKKDSLKKTIYVSEVITDKSVEISPHKRPSQEFEKEVLTQPPKVNLNKTVAPQRPKKAFKPIHLTRDLSKTMTVTDQLEEFYANFMNRDNNLFEIEEIKPRDYLHRIVPRNFAQTEDNLQATLHKSLVNTAKKDNFLYESFEDKTKKELLDIIEQTLKNIEHTNNDQEIAELYFNSVQKAIDIKLYETEKNELKATLVSKSFISKNSLHSKKSKRSRAAEVIKKANEDIEIEY